MKQVLMIFILLCLVAMSPSHSFSEWKFQFIDNDIDPSTGEGWPSLAVDGNGKAHVCYIDEDYIEYATNTSGAWNTFKIVKTNELWTRPPSICVTADGIVSICYTEGYVELEEGLIYLTNKLGTWDKAVIPTISVYAVGYEALDIDSTGNAYISYIDTWDDSDLKYATNASGSWQISTLVKGDFGGDECPFHTTAIAVDRNNKVHIAYLDHISVTGFSIKYVNNISVPNPIRISDYEPDNPVGGFINIAVDNYNHVHISYTDPTIRENIMYATNSNGSWEKHLVWSGDGINEAHSLAVDVFGIPHIAFEDSFNLRYANWTGSDWQTEIVDVGWPYANEPSLSLDSSGHPHIAYRGDDGVQYAYNDGPTPPPPPTPPTTPPPSPPPSPTPTPLRPIIDSGDYNGDGTSDIAIFRANSGLWAVRGITRVYFGGSNDQPIPGNYNGGCDMDIAIFRPASGLWAIREFTRMYFGGTQDYPLTLDMDGAGREDPGIYRSTSGLWAVRGVTRFYFGGSDDIAIPARYRIPANDNPAIFRPASGLWAIRGITRTYFGASSDQPVPGDYRGDTVDDIGIFRKTSGLWAIKGVTRVYFGESEDIPE
jgi:hypothetical protein